jgi:hypothetical protein
MTTTTQTWEVIRGFGPFTDDRKACFDVERLKRHFATEADAVAFAESHYEKRVSRLMRTMPDWWQSFFVIVRPSKTAAPLPTVADLAKRFDAVLREWLTADEYNEVLRLNRTEEYDRSCASHNFCDANVAMMETMLALGVNADSEGGRRLFNAAWDAWRIFTKADATPSIEDIAADFDAALKQSLIPCDYYFMLDLNRQPQYLFPDYFTDANLVMTATVKKFNTTIDAVWEAWRNLHK